MIRFLFSCLLVSARLWAQADSKLQLHFVDVGQADSAILISPGGQVAAFDIGRDVVDQNCDRPMGYYNRLGIRKIDLYGQFLPDPSWCGGQSLKTTRHYSAH